MAAHYKAYLSHPVEVKSITDFLGKLPPWGRVRSWLAPRLKEGLHLNSMVGRVELENGDNNIMFEYGVTDLQPVARKKKRKALTYHMYVQACGTDASTHAAHTLAAWWLAQLTKVVGSHTIIDQPNISVVAARRNSTNQQVDTVPLQELPNWSEAEALAVSATSASSEPLSPSPPPPSGSSDVGLATHQVPSSSSEVYTAPPLPPSAPSFPRLGDLAWKDVLTIFYKVYNAEKLDDIDNILSKYRGVENQAYAAAFEKYASGQPPRPPPNPPASGVPFHADPGAPRLSQPQPPPAHSPREKTEPSPSDAMVAAAPVQHQQAPPASGLQFDAGPPGLPPPASGLGFGGLPPPAARSASPGSPLGKPRDRLTKEYGHGMLRSGLIEDHF